MSIKFNSVYRRRYIIHVLFWICWALFYLEVSNRNPLVVFSNLLAFMPTTYFVVWQLHRSINKVYQKGSLKALLLFGFVWLISAFFYMFLDRFLSGLFYGSKPFDLSLFLYELIYSLFFVISVPVTIELLFLILRKSFEMQQLQEEKHKASIDLLKSQLHPHFLFNTLNNIYSVALKSPESTADLILKLSDLLRYLLVISKKEKVSLKEEIGFIENYIELEKIRLDDPSMVSLTIDGLDADYSISPIILLPLIENAFKHGVSKAKNSYISILILIREGILNVIVENKKYINEGLKKEPTSIGLKNLEKRLSLLYPDTSSLNISETSEAYRIELVISLEPYGTTR